MCIFVCVCVSAGMPISVHTCKGQKTMPHVYPCLALCLGQGPSRCSLIVFGWEQELYWWKWSPDAQREALWIFPNKTSILGRVNNRPEADNGGSTKTVVVFQRGWHTKGHSNPVMFLGSRVLQARTGFWKILSRLTWAWLVSSVKLMPTLIDAEAVLLKPVIWNWKQIWSLLKLAELNQLGWILVQFCEKPRLAGYTTLPRGYGNMLWLSTACLY